MRHFVLSLLLLFAATQTVVADEVTAQKALDRYERSMAGLQDVKAKAYLDLNLTVGFFPYTEKLQGRYYHLHPNRHRLEFDNAPSYFDKVPSMFEWDLPPADKYLTKVKGPFGEPSARFYQILYLPKSPDSSTQSILLSFSADSWRLLSHETSYRDGGSVALRFSYLNSSKLPVLERVVAEVSIPAYSVRGGATITFSEQKINQGLGAEGFR